MAFVIIILLLIAGLCAIGFGVWAIAQELDGIAEDEANRNGAERHGQELFATCSAGGPPAGGIKGAMDAERDAEKRMMKTREAWREGR